MKIKITLLFLLLIFTGTWGQIGNFNLHPLIRNEIKISNFILDDVNNQIIITKISVSNYSLGWGRSENIWKEIYGVVNGKIKLIKRIDGRIIPAVTTPERIEWNDKK